jgi:hypothetical protein
MASRFLIAGIAALTALATASGEPVADGKATVERVLAQWQHRRERITSVRYKLEGHTFYPRGSKTSYLKDRRNPYPPEDMKLPLSVECTFAFPQLKLRIHRSGSRLSVPLGQFRPYEETLCFDGVSSRTFTPREKNTSDVYTPAPMQPDLHVYPNELPFFMVMADSYPMLFAEGYVPPPMRSLSPKFSQNVPDRISWYFSHDEAVDDRMCVVLKSTPLGDMQEVLWVDERREGAIVRWQSLHAGHVARHCDIAYQQVDANWVPERWTSIRYNPPATTIAYSDTMVVTSAVCNPVLSVDAFDFHPRSKDIVFDVATNSTFVVGADGRTLLPPGGQVETSWMWLFWCVLVLILVVVAYTMLRRLRSRQPT